MTKITFRSVAICILAVQAVPSNSNGMDQAVSQQSANAEIRELESDYSQAIVTGDVDFFDRALTEDFTHTSASGRHRKKSDWMQDRKPGQTPYVSYYVENLEIRVYRDVAVVTGLAKAKWKENGEVTSGQYQIIRIWAKNDGRWKAVAFQSTKANDK